MAADRSESSEAGSALVTRSTAELVAQLSRFDGPPEQFLINLLALQCHVASAAAGAILRVSGDGRGEVIAVYPPLAKDTTAPVWLAQAAEQAPKSIAAGGTVISALHDAEELYGQSPSRHLVMVPLTGAADARGLAAFAIKTGDAKVLEESRNRLELTVALMSLYEMRLTLQRREANLRRLRTAMETLAGVNEQQRFASAAMTLCNETASRWQCDRVSLGFLRGRYVQLRAMSHTEKFSRKMKVVQDIEAAMEECLDQDLEIVYPPADEAVYVNRAAGELSRRHGPTAIVSLPLRSAGNAVAVVTAERAADKPFPPDEVESLRLTMELCTARLVALSESDRWFGARLAGGVRKVFSHVLGARATWAKAAAILVLAGVLFLIFAKGQYTAQGPFALEANVQRLVPAPFDGFLEKVSVKPGDSVTGGKTVLATLDTVELRLKLGAAKVERIKYLREAAAAMRDGKTVEAQIARFQAERVASEIQLIEDRIRRAGIVAPIDGTVVEGDIEKLEGKRINLGDVLFRVAPLGDLRAELSVEEDQIADVLEALRRAENQGHRLKGELSTVSHPDKRIEFVVERINPVAEVVENRNVFKVRVRLVNVEEWMRPGMEGVARISIDRRRYAWIWTRKLVNWLRMKLWL